MIYLLSNIKWRVFVPVFLLFFSFVFGVAVDLLGDAQLFIRLIVILIIIAFIGISKIKISARSLFLCFLFIIYLALIFINTNNPITLNCIYLSIVICYFLALRIAHVELLSNSLLASVLVIILYSVYFFIGPINIGETSIQGRVRYSFGFSNPNKLGIVTYSLIVLATQYSFYRKKSIISTLLVISPFFVIMIYSGSRTALYSSLIYFLIILIPYSERMRRFLFLIPVMFLMVSLYLATLHGDLIIDKLLSYRPTDYNNFISPLTGWNYLFGANSSGFRVDNSYILALFSMGVVGFAVASYLFYRMGSDELNKYSVAFIVSILFYGLFEGVLVRVEFPIVLYFYYLLVNTNKSNKHVLLSSSNKSMKIRRNYV